jgi:hypothetical protein
MAILATENQRFSNTVKQELWPEHAYCRDVVTYNGAAKEFKIGDLIEADGTTANLVADIVGVVLQNKSAALNTATKVVYMKRGPAAVSKFGINLNGLVAADVYAALEAKGIQVLDAV